VVGFFGFVWPNGSAATGGTATGDTMFPSYPRKFVFPLDNLGCLRKLIKATCLGVGPPVVAGQEKHPSRRICTKSHSCPPWQKRAQKKNPFWILADLATKPKK